MKTQILETLGEDGLGLPSQIETGLAANDRLKYYFSLLQVSRSHAENPDQASPSLRQERIVAGIANSALDQTVAAAPQGRNVVPTVRMRRTSGRDRERRAHHGSAGRYGGKAAPRTPAKAVAQQCCRCQTDPDCDAFTADGQRLRGQILGDLLIQCLALGKVQRRSQIEPHVIRRVDLGKGFAKILDVPMPAF